MAEVGVIVGQLLSLLVDRINYRLASVADVDTVQPGKAIQQFIAIAIVDINPFTTGHHDLGGFLAHKLTEVGVWMKKTLPIPAFELSLFEHILPWVCWVCEKGGCYETGTPQPPDQSKKTLYWQTY